MKIKMILRKYGLNALIILAEVVSIILTFLFLNDLTQFLWIAAFVVNFIAYLWILNLDTNPEFKIPWISIVLLIQPLGSIHAKNVIVDDEYAVAGTINFDCRSLVHHYENALWMYRTAVIPSMKKDFLDTEEKSMKID